MNATWGERCVVRSKLARSQIHSTKSHLRIIYLPYCEFQCTFQWKQGLLTIPPDSSGVSNNNASLLLIHTTMRRALPQKCKGRPVRDAMFIESGAFTRCLAPLGAKCCRYATRLGRVLLTAPMAINIARLTARLLRRSSFVKRRNAVAVRSTGQY